MKGIKILFGEMKYFKKFNLIFVKMTISHKMFSLSLKYSTALMLVEQRFETIIDQNYLSKYYLSNYLIKFGHIKLNIT